MRSPSLAQDEIQLVNPGVAAKIWVSVRYALPSYPARAESLPSTEHPGQDC